MVYCETSLSAIAGVFCLDGQPSKIAETKAMISELHRRLQNSTLSAQGVGPIALATASSLATTDTIFQQNLLLSADLRLDNRDQLRDQLSLPQADDRQLLCQAYIHWGEDCVEHLMGDFAFAIWNSTQQKLFCARDRVGAKPFYYFHHANRVLAFASEIKALKVLPKVPTTINEERLADFLTGFCNNHEYTFTEGIQRLPAGHRLIASTSGLRVSRYWALDSSTELAADQDHTPQFLELFTEAVHCRISKGDTGLFLSGGLDSCAIAGIARQRPENEDHPLHTFTAISDAHPECDERAQISHLMKGGGLNSHLLQRDGIHPSAGFDEIFQALDEPFYAPGLMITWELHKLAAERGMRTMLSGHGGDEIVSHGFGYERELASSRRWLALMRELRGRAKLMGESFPKLLWPHLKEQWLRPFAKRLRPSRPQQATSSQLASWQQVISPELSRRVALTDRYQEHLRQTLSFSTAREHHFASLTNPTQTLALEILDHAGAAHGAAVHSPFWDSRLAELCLALPTAQKVSNGCGRFILRQSLAAIIPDRLRWRRDKTNFFSSFQSALLQDEGGLLQDAIFSPPGILEQWFQMDSLRQRFQEFAAAPSRVNPGQLTELWVYAQLKNWTNSC